jgi:cysteinyl-tRNA synthetase
MDEDFGTPEAVAVLFDLATQVNSTKSAQLSGLLKALGGILGLLQNEPRAWLQGRFTQAIYPPLLVNKNTFFPPTVKLEDIANKHLSIERIDALISERIEAKKAKNFALADQIRNDLLAQGIVLKDSPTGTTWETA